RAVASDTGHFVSEVNVGSFFEDFDFCFGRNLVNHRLELVVLERREIHPHQIAIDAKHWRIVCGKMQVGSLLLGHQFEKGVNASHERRATRSYIDATSSGFSAANALRAVA